MPDPVVPSKLVLKTPRFKRAVLGWIDRFVEDLPVADTARQFKAQTATKQAESLRGLRAYLSELDHSDARFFQLAEATGRRLGAKNFGGEPFYDPTPSARRIFYAAGLGAPMPPAATLDLLVSASVADVTREWQAFRGDAERDRKAAIADRDKAEARATELEDAATERTDLAAQLERTQHKLERLQARIADLEGFLAVVTEGKRRVKVDDSEENTGIYQAANKTAGKLVYEVVFEVDGKQKYHRLPPDASIGEARRMREKLAGQPHDPDPADVDGSGDDAAEDVLSGDADPAEASQDAGDQETTPEPVAAGGE